MTKDTQDSIRSKLIMMKALGELGEERHYQLTGDNLRNLEVMFRECALVMVQAQKEVLSSRVYKNWRRQMKEHYLLA